MPTIISEKNRYHRRDACLRPYSALLSSNTTSLVLKARNAGGGCTTNSSNIGGGSGSGDGDGVDHRDRNCVLSS